ncbi:hypothetical protein Ddye_030862 [Dipteronia dyeriana]|uniref:Uncharacterized protein n=1 Tax=Dipteronia dyeriana TaxID=168575 RepID=A0AAD9TIE8_9ROSI|nr:hypothetical protein Ddye_030862 [Dipteronia dyeriana]
MMNHSTSVRLCYSSNLPFVDSNIFGVFGGMKELRLILLGILLVLASLQVTTSYGDHPLSRIAIHKATFALNKHVYVKASPAILGLKSFRGQNSVWVTVEFSSPNPSVDDWIGWIFFFQFQWGGFDPISSNNAKLPGWAVFDVPQSQVDDSAPEWAFRPCLANLRYGTAPHKAVCTENLTPMVEANSLPR